ncbi:MAG: RNA polymerase sigma factor, partial [Planctomycetota bacterium]
MSHDLQDLLDRSGWVNRLARSLVADPHAADDLVQEAWLVALRRGGPAGADRPDQERWLSAVLRNLARDRRRGEVRRRTRERETAQAAGAATESGGAEGDGAVLIERLEAHRRVVEAVRDLDEPYRTAVLMRYFEGVGPARIARRLGVPVRTVHSRLHRGLSKLRERLSRDIEGGRGAWLLALLPLSERSGWTSGALAGALAMDAKLKVTLAGAALAGAAAVATLSGPRSVSIEEPAAVARPDDPVRLAAVGEPAPAALPEVTARERVGLPAANAAPAAVLDA